MSAPNSELPQIEASWNQLVELVNQVQDADGLTRVGAGGWTGTGVGERIPLEAGEREVRAAPLDRGAAHVAAGDRSGEVAPPPGDAAAAAAEIEHGLKLREWCVRGDRVEAGAAAAEKPVGVARTCDAHPQASRRERRPFDDEAARRPECDQALVGTERRPDESEAVE